MDTTSVGWHEIGLLARGIWMQIVHRVSALLSSSWVYLWGFGLETISISFLKFHHSVSFSFSGVASYPLFGLKVELGTIKHLRVDRALFWLYNLLEVQM